MREWAGIYTRQPNGHMTSLIVFRKFNTATKSCDLTQKSTQPRNLCNESSSKIMCYYNQKWKSHDRCLGKFLDHKQGYILKFPHNLYHFIPFVIDHLSQKCETLQRFIGSL